MELGNENRNPRSEIRKKPEIRRDECRLPTRQKFGFRISDFGFGPCGSQRKDPMKSPFRGYTAILYKEFLVVLRDPMTLFFMFFPPLIEMIAFGYALDTDVKHMATLVLDED